MSWLTKALPDSWAKALTQMLHSGRPSFFSGLLKRTRFDYRKEVGDCLDSSVVTAPVQFLQRSLPEARLALKRRGRGGKVTELPDHEMLSLIQNPNPFYGDIALWFATILSWCIAGNAYWVKVRNRAGKPVELWYVPHWMMEAKAPQDGSAFLSHYEYKPGGGLDTLRFDPDDVIHFRHGIDPRNLRLGLSPIDGVIREIFADLESSNFVAALLRNMGVPGVVISPKAGSMPTPDDVEATKTWFKQAFGGDNRGGPLVMGAPTDVQPYGFNPQQMNLSEARDVAEERVCACLGVPAAVVGFGAGLQSTKVGATMTELRKLAWHNGILPMGRAMVDELKRSLLPDFERGETAGLELYWNTDDVLALQEDEDKQEERAGKALDRGAITIYEYRQQIGIDADDSHKVYLRPISKIEVAEGAVGKQADPAQPALPAPKGQKSADHDDHPRGTPEQIKRGEAFVLLLQRQERGLQTAFENRLKPFFAKIGKAAKDAALPLLGGLDPAAKAHKASVEQILADVMEMLAVPEWEAELTQAYGAHYLEVLTAVQDAAESAGLGTSLPDPVARAIVATGGRRVGLIDLDGQTRAAIYEALAEGRAQGEGVDALARRIEMEAGGGPWTSPDIRARIIARTETKFAQNISTIERAAAAGVAKMMVFDGRLGPGRSLETHMARNGSIVTVEEATAMAVAEHPNGTLSFAPYFGDDQ